MLTLRNSGIKECVHDVRCYDSVLPPKFRKLKEKRHSMECLFKDGGQGGIRTLGDITASHAFQACAFDHSATCPFASSSLSVERDGKLAMLGAGGNSFFSACGMAGV